MYRFAGNTSDYGFIFDFLDWDNYYILVVDPGAQWYGVAKFENGGLQLIVLATYSPHINPDNGTNHLRVERDGDQIGIYVNGEHLETANDAGFGGSLGVGLYGESDSDTPASVRYDNFAIWELESGSPKSPELRSHMPESPIAREVSGAGTITLEP